MIEVTGCCWGCATPLGEGEWGRQGECPQCGRHTHVCLNCRFYDLNAYNSCHEPQADRVVDKEKANFCDYFKPLAGQRAGVSPGGDAKGVADALFRK